MASVFKEGKGWAVRNRSANDTYYKAGFPTEAKANKWLRAHELNIASRGRTRGRGPDHYTLAMALFDSIPERLPFLKSAPQMLRRLNCYLRHGQLDTYELTAIPRREREKMNGSDSKKVYFEVTTVESSTERIVPRGLEAFRKAQAAASEGSDKLRARLACTVVSKITRQDIQGFMNELKKEGAAASTLQLERAVLREFFNHARKFWNWSDLHDNPARDLDLPAVRNSRNRVLSVEEAEQLEDSLDDSRNPYVKPFIALLLETAMRQSELLVTTEWRDIDWERRVLKLWDAKHGPREVPLTQNAVAILLTLPRGADTDRVFPITIATVNSAWYKAVKRAGIKNIRKHDLRHCALTNFAKLLNGNIFLLKLVSGHVTLEQLVRYINATAEDAVAALDAAQAVNQTTLHAHGNKHVTVDDAVQALEHATLASPSVQQPDVRTVRPMPGPSEHAVTKSDVAFDPMRSADQRFESGRSDEAMCPREGAVVVPSWTEGRRVSPASKRLDNRVDGMTQGEVAVPIRSSGVRRKASFLALGVRATSRSAEGWGRP